MIRQPPGSPPFPYTTPFQPDPNRLPFALRGVLEGEAALPRGLTARLIEEFRTRGKRRRLPLMRQRGVELTEREWERSEEHTSELQPRQYLVCRLLLDKDDDH